MNLHTKNVNNKFTNKIKALGINQEKTIIITIRSAYNTINYRDNGNSMNLIHQSTIREKRGSYTMFEKRCYARERKELKRDLFGEGEEGFLSPAKQGMPIKSDFSVILRCAWKI